MTPQHEIEIPSGRRILRGNLAVPKAASAVVAFAHGSGSGRHSPRNQYVAQVLNQGGIATLRLDLLEEEEAEDRRKVFDIGLLADRLQFTAAWLQDHSSTNSLPLGYFGASTGAGAALVAAANEPTLVRAVVSRGGRPDLARDYLPLVQAPTLLIVGGNDEVVIELNHQAQEQMRCLTQLVVIPGASHLFEEPGTLEEVARLAKEWFLQYLV